MGRSSVRAGPSEDYEAVSYAQGPQNTRAGSQPMGRGVVGGRYTRTSGRDDLAAFEPDKKTVWPVSLWCADGPPLLKTFAAENRAPLRGTKRNRRFFAALRAGRLGFRSHLRGAAAIHRAAFSSLGFAALATLG